MWEAKGDPVLHIDLRKWADLLVIAPLSANTLAKMAQGLCDNCLTSVVRAWDFSKPLLVSTPPHTTSCHVVHLLTLCFGTAIFVSLRGMSCRLQCTVCISETST